MPLIERNGSFSVRTVLRPGLRVTIGAFKNRADAVKAEAEFQLSKENAAMESLEKRFLNISQRTDGKWQYNFRGSEHGAFESALEAAHKRRRAADNFSQIKRRARERKSLQADGPRRRCLPVAEKKSSLPQEQPVPQVQNAFPQGSWEIPVLSRINQSTDEAQWPLPVLDGPPLVLSALNNAFHLYQVQLVTWMHPERAAAPEPPGNTWRAQAPTSWDKTVMIDCSSLDDFDGLAYAHAQLIAPV